MLFNYQIVCGRITKKPEITKNGEKSMARFGIATEVYKKGAGEYNKQTIYENIVIFGQQAEYLERSNIDKGHIFVGVCKVDEYQKDGDDKKYRTLIPVEFQTFDTVRRESNNSGNSGASTPRQQSAPASKPADEYPGMPEDDLPF